MKNNNGLITKMFGYCTQNLVIQHILENEILDVPSEITTIADQIEEDEFPTVSEILQTFVNRGVLIKSDEKFYRINTKDPKGRIYLYLFKYLYNRNTQNTPYIPEPTELVGFDLVGRRQANGDIILGSNINKENTGTRMTKFPYQVELLGNVYELEDIKKQGDGIEWGIYC